MQNYDFKLLSHYDFELLVRDLLQKELNITLESFKSGRDGGIDLRYSINSSNTLIVQCKHYASSDFKTLHQNLKKNEAPKVEKLNPEKYVLVTSIGLTPPNKEEIKSVFLPYCKSDCEVYGREDINNFLGKFPEIERKNFKLWLTSQTVLDKVLHSSIYSQSENEVEAIKKKLGSYVQSQSFFDACKILEELHYCIITGIPGIGKTTLAEILLIHYLNLGYQPIVISSDVSEGFDVVNSSEKQVFYYDDFLGQTSLSDKLNKNEDQRLLRFVHLVGKSKNLKFVLTTREYILNQARSIYERLNNPSFHLSRCVVDLASYSKFDRVKILFNHIYFSGLSRSHVKALLAYKNYMKIINHKNYSPRIIEGMTDYLSDFDIKSENYFETFIENLDNPHKLWRHAFENQLPPASKNLLVVLVTLPEQVFLEDLNTAFNSFHRQHAARHHYSTSTDDFRNSLKNLEANFISIDQIQEHTLVQFHNPSIRDFLETYIVNDTNIIEELFEGSVFFYQFEKTWRLILEKKASWMLKSNEPPLSEIYLDRMEKSFASPSCNLTKYVISDFWNNYFYKRSDISFEKRVLLAYESAQVLQSNQSIEVFERLLAKLFSIYEKGSKPHKGMLVTLLEYFKKNSFNDVPSVDSLLELSKNLFLEDLNEIDDYERFADLNKIFPNIIFEEDKEKLRKEFLQFYPDETYDYLHNVEDWEAIDYFAEILEEVSVFFEVNTQKELDKLRERAGELEEGTSKEDSDYDSHETYRRESKSFDNENTQIESLFSTLLED